MGSAHSGKISSNVGHANRLLYALLIIGTTMILEVIGGIMSHSLALLSDAGHMFTDFIALGVSWIAYKIAQKKADLKRSYGYHRFQVVAAFVNGLMLFLIAFFIVIEAVKRFMHPVHVEWGIMLIIAILGLIANIAAFFVLYQKHESNLNVHSAVVHIIGDLLGSVAAIVSAVVIKYTNWHYVDPILSVFVSLLILTSAYRIVKESGHILLEGTPNGIHPDDVKSRLLSSIESILDVHHIHIWSLTTDQPIMTLHLKVRSNADFNKILQEARSVLEKEFNISHATVEIESSICPDDL